MLLSLYFRSRSRKHNRAVIPVTVVLARAVTTTNVTTVEASEIATIGGIDLTGTAVVVAVTAEAPQGLAEGTTANRAAVGAVPQLRDRQGRVFIMG